jgi:hypothetical protein
MSQSFVYRCCGTALVLASAFAFTGCGGGTTPSAAGSVPASAALRPQIPVPRAGSAGRLIYVSDSGSNTVYFYTYPGGKLEGSTDEGISEPQGVCSEQNGDVWVANTGTSQLLKYAHGSIMSSGSLTTSGEYPVGCSVDKKGNVAVSDIISTSDTEGNVEIFKGGKGSATSVTCPNLYRYYFLAYDSKGNIFVDGEDSSYAFAFCEIPSGSTSGEAIALNVNPEFPGEVQWDGKYVAIADQDTGTIDRFLIRGTRGTEKGTLVLDDATGWFSLVSRHRALSFVSQGLGLFKYPAGGSAIKTVPIGGLSEPVGFALSPSTIL